MRVHATGRVPAPSPPTAAAHADSLPTAHRIQELGRQLGGEHVRVQLWDVAGGPAWQQHWDAISQVTWPVVRAPGS